ncbi:MAG: monovalent cation:proton antiporter-2 (CPA2) family protein [Pseudomonadales bacterium]
MTFLTELFVYLVAALAIVPLLNRLGLSSVIGYLVAGIIIGPSGLGFIAHATETLHFAEIGVVLLLFVIGLELQPKRLWVMRRNVFGLGSAQVLVVTAILSGLIWSVLDQSFTAALVLGFALALSSTAFVLQLLAEQKALNQPHGRAAFGVLLLQDIAVIPAIVLLTALGDGTGEHGSETSWPALAAVTVTIVLARFMLKPLLKIVAHTGIHELFIAASLAIVCGAALLMQSAGLSMGLGAFIAGMLVADSEYRHQLETDVTPFKGLLLGLFFIAVGMSTNIGLLITSPGLIALLTLALVAAKMLALFPLARAFGFDNGASLRATTILSQGGEFAFVLLTTAVSSALIQQSIMEMAVLVVTLSMATTPFLMMGLEKLLNRDPDARPFDEVKEPSQPIIIVGFGRVGQIVGRILTAQQQPFTALDISPAQVDFVRDFGNEVYFGDATRLDLLVNAGVRDAKAMVISVGNVDASVKIAELMRRHFPDVQLFARARNRQHEIKLRNIGVHYVIRETLKSTLDLTRNLFTAMGLDPDRVDAFEAHDRETLTRQAAVVHDPRAFRQTTVEAQAELKLLFADDKPDDRPEP